MHFGEDYLFFYILIVFSFMVCIYILACFLNKKALFIPALLLKVLDSILEMLLVEFILGWAF
jgi:hypothetical protein